MTWHQVCVYSMIKDRGYISHHSKSNCVWNSQSAVVSCDWFHPQAAQRIDTMSWELQRQRWFLLSKLCARTLPKIVLLSMYHSSYCALMYERSYTSVISVLLYVEGSNADCKAEIHHFPFFLKKKKIIRFSIDSFKFNPGHQNDKSCSFCVSFCPNILHTVYLSNANKPQREKLHRSHRSHLSINTPRHTEQRWG